MHALKRNINDSSEPQLEANVSVSLLRLSYETYGTTCFFKLKNSDGR